MISRVSFLSASLLPSILIHTPESPFSTSISLSSISFEALQSLHYSITCIRLLPLLVCVGSYSIFPPFPGFNFLICFSCYNSSLFLYVRVWRRRMFIIIFLLFVLRINENHIVTIRTPFSKSSQMLLQQVLHVYFAEH